MSTDFQLELLDGPRADVYVACAAEPPVGLIDEIDKSGLRAIGDLPNLQHDEDRLRRIMSGCSAVITVPPVPEAPLRIARALALPICTDVPVGLVPTRSRIPAYGFFIGRLERDFAHAREAIRAAVEQAAGTAFLWVDDGLHRTNVSSVRERTRLLIEHAAFLIADLTLGCESPERENPSRAHEIGMAVAYNRRLMLTSQEPRRYPYFSIGDLQMTFWATENELEEQVRAWIHMERPHVARHVYNTSPAPFTFDPERRYVGPNTPHESE